RVLFQAEDGIRDFHVTEFRRVLFRSRPRRSIRRRTQRAAMPTNIETTKPRASVGMGVLVVPLSTASLIFKSPAPPMTGIAIKNEIGRASCRERQGNRVDGVSLKDTMQ